MAYQMAATAVTLNDLEGHSPIAGLKIREALFVNLRPLDMYALLQKIFRSTGVS